MRDYYTTENITDLISELTHALWQFEKRADKQEIEWMNGKLMNLRVYPEYSDEAMQAKLKIAGL
jgi:hypothetical protein